MHKYELSYYAIKDCYTTISVYDLIENPNKLDIDIGIEKSFCVIANNKKEAKKLGYEIMKNDEYCTNLKENEKININLCKCKRIDGFNMKALMKTIIFTLFLFIITVLIKNWEESTLVLKTSIIIILIIDSILGLYRISKEE